MRKYGASGAAPAGGVALLLALAIAGGAITGGILWAIEHFTGFYLVVLFPLVAGGKLPGHVSTTTRFRSA